MIDFWSSLLILNTEEYDERIEKERTRDTGEGISRHPFIT